MKRFFKFTYRFSLCSILGALTVGCESWLDVTVYSQITGENMWKTDVDAKAAVMGAYSQFRSLATSDNFLYYYELRSGNWTVGTSGGQSYDDLFYNTMDSQRSPGTNWSSFYKLINDVNAIIKYAPNVSWGNEADKGDYLADAYFMRAYAYFAMIRIWGDVPLVLEPVEDDVNIYPSRAPQKDVMQRIYTDIESALTSMKSDGPRDPAGLGLNAIFVTKAAINMLKADVILWDVRVMGGNPDLLDDAMDAVDYVLSKNYELETDYAQVFRNEMSKECILSSYMDVVECGTPFTKMFLPKSTDVSKELRNNPIPVQKEAQWLTMNSHYIETYYKPDIDTRATVNYMEYKDKQKTHKWVNKWQGELINDTRYHTSDIRLYRLAEAYMFKAEILNESNRPADAVAVLNHVIERAYGEASHYPTSLSKGEVNDALLYERIVEFTAEGKAWFDYIRFGKAFELIESLKGRENDNKGNILLFPVAQGTLDKNQNINQTPGYEN